MAVSLTEYLILQPFSHSGTSLKTYFHLSDAVTVTVRAGLKGEPFFKSSTVTLAGSFAPIGNSQFFVPQTVTAF